MNYLSLKRQLKSLTVIQNDSQAVLYNRGSLTILPVAQQPARLREAPPLRFVAAAFNLGQW